MNFGVHWTIFISDRLTLQKRFLMRSLYCLKNSSYLLTIVFCVVLVGLPSRVNSEELDINRLQSQIFSAVDKVMPAVVAISDRGAIFSGVIVSKEGHVLTAGHAVSPKRVYTVMLADGRRFRTKGLGSNKRVDMAMLKISSDQDLPFAEMGHSSVVVRNQPCVGVSHPGLYDANRGPIVRFGHILQPVTSNEGMIKSTAKMEPGDSGGPLVDLDGKVIGIHSNIRRDEKSNYDVPVDSFRKHWDDLLTPKEFFVNGYPSLPKLGFRGTGDDLGVKVLKVYEGGQAEQFGLQPNDFVTSVGGLGVKRASQIYSRLFKLRSDGVDECFVNVNRGDKKMSIRFKLMDDQFPTPTAYPELPELVSKFAKLESKLDDNMFVIRSQIGKKSVTVCGTRVKIDGRGNLISKSSRIGTNPRVELSTGGFVSADIVSRDSKNDLVLLRANLPGTTGIDLRRVYGDVEEKPGKLLITPSSKDGGEISVWGSKYFAVNRTLMSGGFLGVEMAVQPNAGRVVFARVRDGAAKAAGVESGDIVLRMDDVEIRRQGDVRNFLRTKDPNSTITALLERNGEQIEKTIVLGNRPDMTGHVADNLIGGKSLRRDGFSLAIAHDADLKPEDCGGPVFDLNGQFLGVNIARSSRVRSYVIPKTVLKQFVNNAQR